MSEVVADSGNVPDGGVIVFVPREIVEEWGRRAANVEENVEAAIRGAIGVDDGLLGDLIETLDLVSKHVEWLRSVAAPSFSTIPAALAPNV